MTLSGSDREALIMSRPWPDSGCCVMRIKDVAEQSTIKKGKIKNQEGRGHALKRDSNS